MRRGKQLWDVGIPNRNGSEFFKGDVYYTPGIGATYGSLFPNDVTYIVGKSDFRKDWFFQHVPHADADAAAIASASRGFRPAGIVGRATPYTIQFDLADAPKGKATLRAAFAGTVAWDRSMSPSTTSQRESSPACQAMAFFPVTAATASGTNANCRSMLHS